MKRRLLLSLAVLAVAAGFSGCRVQVSPSGAAAPEPSKTDTATPAPHTGKMLLMHYMPWYVTPGYRGYWGSHWKGYENPHHPDQLGTNGLPDIWSHFHPLIGPYDSADPAAIECHLLQMKLAGVDGVLIDWYGISKNADYPEVQQASEAMFAATEKYGMKFSVCYEDRSLQLLVDWKKLQPTETTGELVRTFAWMQTNWFTHANYVQWENRPLVLNFGPVYLDNTQAWNEAFSPLPVRPAFFALHHLWRKAGADGGFTWVHFDPWEDTPTEETIHRRIGEVFTYFSQDPREVIVSACPGFHDIYENDLRDLAYRDGSTLREMLDVAMAGPWPLVQLVTWNDYGEGTMIEPTHEFGYRFLEIVQQARKAEQGDAFRFTADDLRLPARLYELRKSKALPEEVLNQAADLITQGKCAEARALLGASS